MTDRPLESTGVGVPVFVSTVMKSGSWLLREILEPITGLTAFEPPHQPGIMPDYRNAAAITFPDGSFFWWHLILNAQSEAKLRAVGARNILLVRNIYELILAMRRHLVEDVDAAIGRSVGGGDYFADKTVEQSISLVIAGFANPRLNWFGAKILLEHMASMLGLAESGDALVLSYSQLTRDKPAAIERIASYLGIPLPEERLSAIMAATAPEAMRARLGEQGMGEHVTRPEQKLSRDTIHPYHVDMIEALIRDYAPPRLKRRFAALGLPDLFTFDVAAS